MPDRQYLDGEEDLEKIKNKAVNELGENPLYKKSRLF